jgi:Fic family protein
LYNYNPLFASLPTESIVRNHQEAYYKALEDSTAIGESTPFIEFMLDMILQTIIRFEDEVGNRVGNKVGNLTQNQIYAKKLDIVNRVGGTRGYWKVKG